ncbi:VanZ family protein [Halobacillus litoralis]|uniref:VanZ-like domain-containing protein n=1 Tax=Halobacillus litoralis TaxID=45668 RepID=A0A410MFJ0_9BACI|nr:VanZ family protein [Halobacillus litoralis]QAS53460.1 hypothetical protein HLI_15260 [Halobacillus litoralis]
MELDYGLILGMDKQRHFFSHAMMAVFSGIVIIIFSNEQSFKRRIKFAWVVLVFIGILEEYRQYMVPDRSAEFLDAVANLLGITIGLLIPVFIIAIISKNKYKSVSNSFAIYNIALIPLFFGLLLINERPFVTFDGSFEEEVKFWLLFIGF